MYVLFLKKKEKNPITDVMMSETLFKSAIFVQRLK